MLDLDASHTDTFVLSMSFDKTSPRQQLGNGGFGIASRNGDGTWVNAVDLNSQGSASFVMGPWKPGYALGTYGIDPTAKTAWAVIDHPGEFAVTSGIELPPGHRK
jgi:hypothetical protein